MQVATARNIDEVNSQTEILQNKVWANRLYNSPLECSKLLSRANVRMLLSRRGRSRCGGVLGGEGESPRDGVSPRESPAGDPAAPPLDLIIIPPLSSESEMAGVVLLESLVGREGVLNLEGTAVEVPVLGEVVTWGTEPGGATGGCLQ